MPHSQLKCGIYRNICGFYQPKGKMKIVVNVALNRSKCGFNRTKCGFNRSKCGI